MDQIVLYNGNYFKTIGNQAVVISIEINFGIFALKFIRYKQKLKKEIDRKQKFNLFLQESNLLAIKKKHINIEVPQTQTQDDSATPKD